MVNRQKYIVVVKRILSFLFRILVGLAVYVSGCAMYLRFESLGLPLDVVWGRILVVGMSGTGKTSLLKSLAEELEARGVQVRSFILDDFSVEEFESKVHSLHNELAELLDKQNIVVLVDDVDVIVARNPHALKILEEIACASKCGVGLVAAVQRPGSLPTTALRCFSTYIVLRSDEAVVVQRVRRLLS